MVTTLIMFIVGIALGAVFSPMWIALWNKFKTTTLYVKIKGWFPTA